VIFFRVFQIGSEQLLSRVWMIDPGETQANVTATSKTKGEKEPWNGEYYVSFGGDCTWDEARKYGLISAGGGSWYSQTLKVLSPGDRIWVKLAGSGYAGVGKVVESMQSVNDFKIRTLQGELPILDVLVHAAQMKEAERIDPSRMEYLVRVQWLDTVPESEAFKEVGLFGNQNTVCQPTSPKWRHTVDRLKTIFTNWNKAGS